MLTDLFPRCSELGLELVSTDGASEHAGFDIDEVKAKLGSRFDDFMSTVNTVFSCGHRIWEEKHPEEHKRGCEVHCVYAGDLEKFLEG
jgi:hypothetical protein